MTLRSQCHQDRTASQRVRRWRSNFSAFFASRLEQGSRGFKEPLESQLDSCAVGSSPRARRVGLSKLAEGRLHVFVSFLKKSRFWAGILKIHCEVRTIVWSKNLTAFTLKEKCMKRTICDESGLFAKHDQRPCGSVRTSCYFEHAEQGFNILKITRNRYSCPSDWKMHLKLKCF